MLLYLISILIHSIISDLTTHELLSGPRDFTGTTTLTSSARLNDPIETRQFTFFGFLRFAGTDARNYYAVTLGVEGTAQGSPSGMANILTIYYSTVEGLNNLWVSLPGSVGSERTVKVINGAVFVPNRWTFISVTADFASGQGKIALRVFDTFPVSAEDPLTLSFRNFELRSSIRANIGFSPEYPGQNWVGSLSNFALINKVFESPDKAFLLSWTGGASPLRGVVSAAALAGPRNETVRGWGVDASSAKFLGPIRPNSPDVGITFVGNSSMEFAGLDYWRQLDLPVRIVVWNLRFSYIEPISDELWLFETGELNSAGSVRLSIIDTDLDPRIYTAGVNLTDTPAPTRLTSSGTQRGARRLKLVMWSLNGKELAYISPINLVENTVYEIQIGAAFHSDHIVNFLFNDGETTSVTPDVSFFQYAFIGGGSKVLNNTQSSFKGAFSLLQLQILDRIPAAGVVAAGGDLATSRKLLSASAPNCAGPLSSSAAAASGCGRCKSPFVSSRNQCIEACRSPLQNYGGVCEWCGIEGCTNLPRLEYKIEQINSTSLRATLVPSPVFAAGGARNGIWLPEAAGFCEPRVAGLAPSEYKVTKTVDLASASCEVTLESQGYNPEQAINIEWVPPSDVAFFYDGLGNELRPANSTTVLRAPGLYDPQAASNGRGLAIAAAVFFFLGFVAGLVCLFFSGDPYIKWRVMYSIHYVHLLGLLMLVNTDLPAILRAFAYELYNIFIGGFNGAFNSALISPIRTGLTRSDPPFWGQGVSPHFLLNFLFPIIFHAVVLAGYAIVVGLACCTRKGLKTGVWRFGDGGDTAGWALNLFEVDILYYAFAWYFLQASFFSLLNFRNSSSALPLFSVSVIFAVIYFLLVLFLLAFLIWVPCRDFFRLDSYSFKTIFGCIYVNYLIEPLRKHWEFVYFTKLFFISLILVFAFASPAAQGVLLFAIWVLFFIFSLAVRPWKSYIMIIIEAISDGTMCLVLLGYLILLAGGPTTPGNYTSRKSLGAFVISFAFIGVFFNMLSIVLWCLVRWLRYSLIARWWRDRGGHPLIFTYPELNYMTRGLGLPPPILPPSKPIIDDSLTRNILDPAPGIAYSAPLEPPLVPLAGQSFMQITRNESSFINPITPPQTLPLVPQNPIQFPPIPAIQIPTTSPIVSPMASVLLPPPMPVFNDLRSSQSLKSIPEIPLSGPIEAIYSELSANISSSKSNFYNRQRADPYRQGNSEAGSILPQRDPNKLAVDEGDRGYLYSVFMKER